MKTIDPSGVRRVLTEEQLRRGASGMSYRVEQLAYITMIGTLPQAVGEFGARAIWNARIESVLVHGRALAYFLRSKLPSKGDLHYSHYSHYSKSVWLDGAEGISDVADEIVTQASIRLAHASIGQPGWEPHPGDWPLAEIAVVLSHGLRDFVYELGNAHPDRAALFGDRPAEVCDRINSHFPGFRRTKISDHPEVGELTKKLQRYIGFEA